MYPDKFTADALADIYSKLALLADILITCAEVEDRAAVSQIAHEASLKAQTLEHYVAQQEGMDRVCAKQ